METKVPLQKPIRELWHTWLLMVALASLGAGRGRAEGTSATDGLEDGQ